MERIYIINLYKEWKKVPIWKRPKKAVKAIKEFLARHMKSEINKIKINPWLNMEIWKNSIRNPPRKIKVKAVKDEKEIIRVELYEKPKKLLKKEKKEEKEENKGKKEVKEKEEEKSKKEENKK